MNIEYIFDDKTKLLIQDLKNDFQIEFKEREIDYCEVYTIKNQATIYYNPKLIDNESIAHELLHIKLKRYNYVIGNHIYFSCLNNSKLQKIFNKFLCDYIGNCLDHFKMYPEYLEMGYSPEGFLKNGLEEKCSLQDIKTLNLSFLRTFKTKSIELYIGYLISIYADHIDNNYIEHLILLQEKDSDLFEVISNFWNKWKEFDITNIDAIYNSDIELADSFVTDMEEWIKHKKVK
jgi:hypothetical protein